MKLAVFSVLLLLALVSSAPTSSEDDDDLTVTRDFFPKEFQIYEAKHNIVKIVAPQNDLNFYAESVSSIFFVEADEKDGGKVDQGLYIMKEDNVTKLLDNGRDITAPMGHSKIAYFAAKDGIYIYNDEKNTAEKYGTVNDDLIGITSYIYHPYYSSDDLYVVTAKKEVFKVTDKGTKKVKVDDVKNAEQIVLDYANNLFYADSKDVYVVNGNGVKKISLPVNHSKITLIKPPIVAKEGIVVLVDKVVYSAFPNGTSESAGIQVNAPVTASSVELSYKQYYGFEKKIYRLHLISLLCSIRTNPVKSCINNTRILRKIAFLNTVSHR